MFLTSSCCSSGGWLCRCSPQQLGGRHRDFPRWEVRHTLRRSVATWAFTPGHRRSLLYYFATWAFTPGYRRCYLGIHTRIQTQLAILLCYLGIHTRILCYLGIHTRIQTQLAIPLCYLGFHTRLQTQLAHPIRGITAKPRYSKAAATASGGTSPLSPTASCGTP